MCVGLTGHVSLPTRTSDLRGSIEAFILQGFSIHVAALSLGGIPPLLGFFAKALLLIEGISFGHAFFQSYILLGLGVTGMLAYLRIGLSVIGHPQPASHTIQPYAPMSGYPQALLLGASLAFEGFIGSSYALLF